MCPAPSRVPFPDLVAAVDRLLDDCEDDYECLAVRLGDLAPEVRDEVLVSDLLNAWQVFYYFFRTCDDDLLRERLELEPASALVSGVRIRETDFLEMFFVIRNLIPVIVVSDGEKAVATFCGVSAFTQGLEVMNSPDYE